MKANYGFGDILAHLVIWVLIIVFTAGIGLFFFPYSFAKFVLNRSQVHTRDGVYQVKCDLDIVSQLGHIVLWFVISIVTFGIGYLFYLYGVWRIALRHTQLRHVGSSTEVAA